MRITAVNQTSPVELAFTWENGERTRVTLSILRDACPCAECAGETVLFKSYVPPPADTATPGRYRLAAVEPVGGYALKFTWGDGHDQGLYTWDHLRKIVSPAEAGS